MSVTSGFFNSLNGDRKYNATSIAKIFDGLINDGIYMTIGNAFLVNAAGGMEVIVKPGRAWFNHTWTLNDADLPLTVEAAELLLSRIDAVVLEVNNKDTVRGNSIKIIKGDPAESPTKPSLVKEGDVYQYALAYITVAPKATQITQANIENVVGTAATPYVNAIVETIDTSQMYAQFTAQFNEWYAGIQSAVADDAVLDLATKMAGLTKADSSIPTLLYRYILFPQTLSDAEKVELESNTTLMGITNKGQYVQLGDIISVDNRRKNFPFGCLKCNGGIIQRADYPEYAKLLSDQSYFIKRKHSGGLTCPPWYRMSNSYTDDYKYANYIADYCTCNGYTVMMVFESDSSTTIRINYACCMVFNPKGTKIFDSRLLDTDHLYGTWPAYYQPDTSFTTPGNMIYFEDPNTVILILGHGDGLVYVKLLIDGDTVTIGALKQFTSSYATGNCTAFHIPGTDYAGAVMFSLYQGQTDTYRGSKSSNYYTYHKIMNEITGSTTWSNYDKLGQISGVSIGVSYISFFYPQNKFVKFSTGGIYIGGSNGYCLIPYGSYTPGEKIAADSGFPHRNFTLPNDHKLLDMCAKKGDLIPYDEDTKMFNIKTKETIDTSEYGCFIGTMIFDTRVVDLYIQSELISSGKRRLFLTIVEGENKLITKFNITTLSATEYMYATNQTQSDAKCFVIVGHKIFMRYPYINSSSYKYYKAPADQYNADIIEVSLDQIQLPNVTITDANGYACSAIRVR